MIVTGLPQFEVQNDYGNGDGIAPIDQWEYALGSVYDDPDHLGSRGLGLDPSIEAIFVRLQNVLNPTYDLESRTFLNTNELHDLTCFVLHKLLLPFPTQLTTMSECVRYAMAIYMFVVHGPTYYSHAAILRQIALTFQKHLQALAQFPDMNVSLFIWCLSVGMSASIGTDAQEWFHNHATNNSHSLGIKTWDDVKSCLVGIFALDTRSEAMFRGAWDPILDSNSVELPDEPNTSLRMFLNETYE